MANQFTYKDNTYGVGDTINVSLKVVEGEKTRTQLFTGILIGIKGKEKGKSFTIRKIASGSIGVERIIPLQSPDIVTITLKSRGKVRRSKLYYLRKRTGRLATRVKRDTKKSKIKPKDEAEKKEIMKPRKTTSQKVSSK